MEAEKTGTPPSRRFEQWFTNRITRSSPSLAEGLAARNDNFLLLRMVAATMVIYGHASSVTGGTGPKEFFLWLGWGTYSGHIAVLMFFVISGFLITGSFDRNPNPLRFAAARALRIAPAYVAFILLSVFAIGVAFTSLSVSEFLAHPKTHSYLSKALSVGTPLQWTLPGVFTDNPDSTTINGSLWTLRVEARMYVWVFALGILGLLTHRWLGNLALLILLAIALLAPKMLPMVDRPAWLGLAGAFALGAACFLNRNRIHASGRLLLMLAIAAYALRRTPVYDHALVLALAAFVFWFAYRLPWRGYNRFGDYSYGTYIWGWPVQQMVAHYWPQLTPIPHALIAIPIAIAFGVLSWKLVEEPSLRLLRGPFSVPLWLRRRASDAPRVPW
jgi:peptidoglycan/LPS O-acetylase OafA/YrhL